MRRSNAHSARFAAALTALVSLGLCASSAEAGGSGEWLLLPVDDAARAWLLTADAPGTLVAALPAHPDFPELARVLRLSADEAPARKWLDAARSAGRLVWAEAAPQRTVDVVPDDARWGELWALPLISAPAAWERHQGQGATLVAVVDTGVQLDHPDLQAAVWTNPLEAAGLPGVDDDGNGRVDDLHGWDLLDDDADPSPATGDQSHGTHVAGTAACVTGNGVGVACPAWNAALLPVRAGHGASVSRGAEGVWYAALCGADVINCSWGGDSYSHYEQAVVDAALELGCVVVASAGNDGSASLHWPAAYEGVLAVAATGPDDRKLSSSQHGWWVDVCAPGSNILSTVIGGGYGSKSGTSMATPLVSSLCALVSDRWPDWGPEAVREQVVASARPVDALNPGYAGQLGQGRVDADRALAESHRALALADWRVEDEGGDGRIDPGEEIELRPLLRCALGSFGPLTATLSFPDGGATPLQASVDYPALAAPGDEAQPAGALRFRVPTDAEPGSRLRVRLTADDGGPAPRALQGLLPVAPRYVTLRGAELALSLSGRGELGYYDFEGSEAVGEGLVWPAGSPSDLYHGSFVLQLEDGEVLDMAGYLLGVAGDFVGSPGGELGLTETAEGAVAVAAFSAAARPGLQVELEAVASNLPARADILLLGLTLRNSGAPLRVRPALWMDFDVAGSWADDTGGWESDLQLAWQSQAGGPFFGLLSLDGPVEAFRLCRYGEWISGGLSDDELDGWLEAGLTRTQSDQPDDWACLLGLEAAELTDARRTGFALVAAATLPELRGAALEARLWWESVAVGDVPPARPPAFELAVAPNPFNPDAVVRLSLPQAARVDWSLHDLLGRRLAGGEGLELPAGEHRWRLEAPQAASGPLWLTVEAGDQRRVLRLTRLK